MLTIYPYNDQYIIIIWIIYLDIWIEIFLAASIILATPHRLKATLQVHVSLFKTFLL